MTGSSAAIDMLVPIDRGQTAAIKPKRYMRFAATKWRELDADVAARWSTYPAAASAFNAAVRRSMRDNLRLAAVVLPVIAGLTRQAMMNRPECCLP
jgi:hypothetical protein